MPDSTESPSFAATCGIVWLRMRAPENHPLPAHEPDLHVQPNVAGQRQRQHIGTHRVTHYFRIRKAPGNACITLVAIFASHLLVSPQYRFVHEVQPECLTTTRQTTWT